MDLLCWVLGVHEQQHKVSCRSYDGHELYSMKGSCKAAYISWAAWHAAMAGVPFQLTWLQVAASAAVCGRHAVVARLTSSGQGSTCRLLWLLVCGCVMWM